MQSTRRSWTPAPTVIQQPSQVHQKRDLPDAAATQALGRELAGQLPPGSILLLLGDLGAGKTCLVQGLARGLGIDEPITSPTFALAQHYQGQRGRALVHLDLYRLELAAAADELAWQVGLELSDPADPDAGRTAWITPAGR